MALPRYLAQTSAEFTTCSSLPEHTAWMACHFSPYGTGLTNLPPALPPGSMVILNDRIPMAGHDSETVLRQLQSLEPHCLLLDFQRPPEPKVLELTRLLIQKLSCPTGVSEAYGKDLNSPLLLPPPPLDTPPEAYLSPWRGREIWLEIGLDAMTYTVTEQGAIPAPLSVIPENGRFDEALFCHYRMDLTPEQAVFSLWRTEDDLDGLLETAKSHGVSKAVGLWQEFYK